MLFAPISVWNGAELRNNKISTDYINMGILVDRFTLPGYRFPNVITVNRIPLENPLTPDTHAPIPVV